jgi:hypothetical protein
MNQLLHAYTIQNIGKYIMLKVPGLMPLHTYGLAHKPLVGSFLHSCYDNQGLVNRKF